MIDNFGAVVAKLFAIFAGLLVGVFTLLALGCMTLDMLSRFLNKLGGF